MSRSAKKPPARGDLLQLDWVDIFEDPTGDPNKAALKRRTSFALFWERREDPSGLDVIVTTTTIDEDLYAQQGYCIYPEACVIALKVIKRARHTMSS